MAYPPSPDTLSAVYHQCASSEDTATALRLARLGLQIPTYRHEACLWLGLPHLQAQAQYSAQSSLAFLYLALALEHRQDQALGHALVVRCLQQLGHLPQALAALEAALHRHPTDRNLRQLHAPLLIALTDAGLIAPTALRTRLQRSLPDITDPQELRQVLEQLGALPNPAAADSPLPRVIGTVWHDPVRQQIGGWLIDLAEPSRALEVEIEFQHQGRSTCSRIPAKYPNPLLVQAGYAVSHGGFRVQLPHPIEVLNVRCADGPALIGSPLAALPVFSPPAPPAKRKTPPNKQPVDVLVPVFEGRQTTLDCVDSVIEHAARNRTPHRLIVLDDASPDVELAAALKKRARQGRLKYLRHPANLGFIRNMNRAMALHPERDVVWLNADTRVHGDWLDRLRTAAYSADDVASATPFSNNGELMSFPRMQHAAPMPDAEQHAALDRAAHGLRLAPVVLETGCGFCLYIKRRALDEVGYLDEVELKRGYGEETDWCLRAHAKGWRHVGAVNVFIAHAGGHSFGPEKALRVMQNNAVLRRRHPQADTNFRRYVAADPLAPARQQLDAALNTTTAHPATVWLHQAKDTPLPNAAPTSASSAAPPLSAALWLIADPLGACSSPGTPQRWLQLARHFARQRKRQQPAPLLLLDQDNPWEVQLLATGQVLKRPQLRGLSRSEILAACGTPVAVQLDGAAAPEWFTHLLAAHTPTMHTERA
ncbi:glycosyltransferase family 2 protein [Thauera aromatica]|uniref:glycosyltransferase family 2 protein n=1 Tax=Thauera aromatica TaxID=59405 RepID=UPI001FFDD894|nr:glycosyltransferase family 2 protein [Thauera aromatica]MCK2086875.1 glycosyltransferase family 2 protein [Thauera aromatica]